MKLLKIIPEEHQLEFLSDALEFYRYHQIISYISVFYIFLSLILTYLNPSFGTMYISASFILCSILLFLTNALYIMKFKQKWFIYKAKR